MKILNEDIKRARKNVPAKLGSFPQDLEHYKTFKVADWKALLELFGTTLLYGHVPNDVHQNFINLHDLWVKAISHRITVSELSDINYKVFVRNP